MKKINKEEYELLKSLDDKWKWIARDSNGNHGGDLFTYSEEPFKRYDLKDWEFTGEIRFIDNLLLQFIQWEDSEPWSVQELIEEYERYEIGNTLEESEETEVKKDIEWLKGRFSGRKIFSPLNDREVGYNEAVEEFSKYVDQLDEPETLSECLIEQKSINTHVDTLNGEIQVTFILDDLQDLLVPKRELPVIPQWVADNIESKKRVGTRLNVAMSEFPEFKLEKELDIDEHECNEIYARAWLDGFTVEEEQKYYLKTGNLYLAEPLGDMTSDIVRVTRDKGVAYQFTDEKSIATHLDKFEGAQAVKVGELEE